MTTLALSCVERGQPVDEAALRARTAAERTAESALAMADAMVFGQLASRGEALFFGRGGCATCHRVDDRGTRYTGPNLGLDPDCATRKADVTRQDTHACEPLPTRARLRRPELSPLQYTVESVVDPDHLTVPGYARGVMKRAEDPPIALTDEDILALSAWLVYREDAPSDISISKMIEPARAFIPPCREQREARTHGEAEPTRPTELRGGTQNPSGPER
jgi:hypothetical protein